MTLAIQQDSLRLNVLMEWLSRQVIVASNRAVNPLNFSVNASTVPIDTSLNTFLRTKAHLSGTKFMCSEGGCGACIVSVKGVHPVSKEEKTWAVNSVRIYFNSLWSSHIFRKPLRRWVPQKNRKIAKNAIINAYVICARSLDERFCS